MVASDSQHKTQDPLLHIADVVGTHGLRGDLKVRPHSGDLSVLLAVARVTLERPDGAIMVASVTRQIPHKGAALLRFKGVDRIEQAEPMVGSKVMVPESALPELDADEFYWQKLSGLQVIDRHHGDLGRLVSMFTTAAHDTYVVEGGYGEVLIPAVKEFIVGVDLERGIIEVDLPVGLVPEQE